MNCNFNAAIKQYAYNELLSHPDDSVRIKSERELCTLYGISRPTVRKALAELEQEGVLIIRHGSGAFTNPAAAKYRQNPNWRRTVGILFGFGNSLVFDSYSWEVVHGAQQILEQNGMVVLPLLQLAGTDDKATEEILRLQLDAVLWLHPDAGRLEVIQRLEAEGLPVVCVGRDPGNFPGTVMYNYRECGRNLARHFLKHGQRNPLLAADGRQTVYQELVRGFEEEMEKAGNVFESRQLLLNLDSLEEDIRRLDKAIRRVPELCIRETDPEAFDPFGCGIPAKRMRLRQAALMETDEIPSGEAAGRIAARSICPCPPGIAAVVPGEEIGPELARRLPGWGIPTVTVVRETG